MSTVVELFGASGLGGAVVMLVRAAARWLRVRAIARRVREEASEPGGPEWGTIGWVWRELGQRIADVRSKGHAVERTQNVHAERLASLETAVFGSNRMQSGEQERIDYSRERMPSSGPRTDADTEPEPLPPMRATGRRSRPG